MTEKSSNISTIVQNSLNKESLTKVNSYLNKEKSELEPSNHKLDNTSYSKVIVHEYVKKDGVIHVIDNSEGNFRVYEIMPNGSYDAKLTNGDIQRIQKTNGNSLVIVNGDMVINIEGGSLTIKTSDGALWKPNTIQICPYTGQPHCTLHSIRGENS